MKPSISASEALRLLGCGYSFIQIPPGALIHEDLTRTKFISWAFVFSIGSRGSSVVELPAVDVRQVRVPFQPAERT